MTLAKTLPDVSDIHRPTITQLKTLLGRVDDGECAITILYPDGDVFSITAQWLARTTQDKASVSIVEGLVSSTLQFVDETETEAVFRVGEAIGPIRSEASGEMFETYVPMSVPDHDGPRFIFREWRAA